jgi:hypothetical protein
MGPVVMNHNSHDFRSQTGPDVEIPGYVKAKNII